MGQLYQKLRDADPYMMPDDELAKHLVTLMTPSGEWRYCRDSLREKVRQGEVMGKPLSSTAVLQRLKHEEVEMRIASSIVLIYALVAGKGKVRDVGDAVPSAYTAGSSNQNSLKNDKAHLRQNRRPGPYDSQQRPTRARQELYRAASPDAHVLSKLLGSPKMLPHLCRYLGRTGRFHTVHGTLPAPPDPKRRTRSEKFLRIITAKMPSALPRIADPFNANLPPGFLEDWAALQAALAAAPDNAPDA
ncbi:hypothetical protein B0H14DRAFT_3449596 [Mycena olivaceomarginata]|nr:hypothetical protein B0H14DRAFT_3449596 [Mycena olivaceomarginata]